MKKYIPTIILALSVLFFIYRMLKVEDHPTTSNRNVLSEELQIPTTEILLSSNLFEMGKNSKGNLKDINVTIFNIGGAELVIQDIEGDCFCTVPVWEDVEVAPGDSTRFSVRITKEETGFFQQNVLVHGNFPNSPKIVRIQGEIVE